MVINFGDLGISHVRSSVIADIDFHFKRAERFYLLMTPFGAVVTRNVEFTFEAGFFGCLCKMIRKCSKTA